MIYFFTSIALIFTCHFLTSPTYLTSLKIASGWQLTYYKNNKYCKKLDNRSYTRYFLAFLYSQRERTYLVQCTK